ncbi:MAG TPA: ABC transporter permease [Pirellulales bacterium]|jgi:putative ABC transport system permease protein|nr:ABC transporter permease [Pirellulales bacterium]
MRFFAFVWKNVSRRKMRSGLTVVGLGVAVAAVVSLFGISDGFSTQFKALYARRGIDLVVQRVGSKTELNNGLPNSLGEDIRKLPGVSAVMGGLMDVVSFPEQNIPSVIINGWAPDSPLFKELHILPGGRLLHAGDHHKVLLGSVLAENLSVKVGDTIPLYGEKAEVVGVFKSDEHYESGSIVALLSDMQQFMNRPHQVTGFIVRAAIPKDASPEQKAGILDQLQRQIDALDPTIAAIPTDQFIDSVGPIKLSRAVAWVTSAIALLIGGIGMLNTMVMSVYERIREIGTLRAIGWKKIQVIRMILVESLLLSLAGGTVGALAAVGLTHVLSHFRQTAGFIQGTVAPTVIVQGFLLAVAIGVGGAIYPAWWGANLRPVEAMRRK